MKRALILLNETTRPVRGRIIVLLTLTGFLALGAAIPAYFMRAIIDGAITKHDVHVLVISVMAMLANAIVFALAGYAQGSLNVRISQSITRTLRLQMADRIYRMPLKALADSTFGSLITRLSNDVDGLEGLWSGSLVTALSNVTQLVIGLSLVFTFSWQLGIIAMIVLPGFTLPLTRLGRSIYRARIASRSVKDRFNTVVAETLSYAGITFIKSHVLYSSELDRLASLNRELQSVELKANDIGLRYSLFNSFTTMATPAAVWFVGYWLVSKGSITLGALLGTITLLLRLFMPATSLAGLQLQITGSSALVDRLREYLDSPRETEGDVPYIDPITHQARGVHLEFDGVSLQFGAGPPVLRDLNFEVVPGEAVALCGASGAGKTSIARLLTRLIAPTAGVIRFDGTDVADLDVHELRYRVGMVAQEPFLLNDSIAANVSLGSASASEADIARACELALASDFIDAFPDRYRTLVGDRGMRLSGGQRQRIALARLFLRSPSVIVLDEATSALDVETEQAILLNLRRHFAYCPLIVITHRESTLSIVDRVIFVHDGRVATRPIAHVA
jgi:ATP-binding cassette subfamily B protein